MATFRDIPTVLTVFGATGDLMRRKIIPSLYYLYDKGDLSTRTCIIGVSRRDWSDEQFRDEIRARLTESPAYHGCSDESLEGFLAMWRFAGGDFDDPGTYERLCATIQETDDAWGVCSNKLYYLAVPPVAYETIFTRMAERGLTRGCGGAEGWTRILVEKPFGNDRASADALNDQLAGYFREEQIYRIDHYLAKEMLQGLLDFRFANNLFEPSWNHGTIDRIEIDLLETIGAEKRGAFYDAVGALRDVGQNHCLEMLALLTMEQPASMSASSIRRARAELLRKLVPLERGQVAEDTARAQYDGFRDIDGVSPDSETETWFGLRGFIDEARWRAVPVYMQAGKRMGEARKRIVVTFRQPDPCLCTPGAPNVNRVTFSLEPTDSIHIEFWTKKPGLESATEMRDFDFFLYEKQEKAQYVEEYSKLIHDAARGDQTLFVSRDEVDACWAFIDPIVETWATGMPQLLPYPADSLVPVESLEAHRGFVASLEKPGEPGSIGVLGLGKMGGNLARRLVDKSWDVHVWNRTTAKALAMREEGATPHESVPDLVAALPAPRLLWLMLPAGAVLDEMLWGAGTADDPGLVSMLSPGDVVIDGGNSRWTDTARRAGRFEGTGIAFLDSGTSGGPAGARNGACLMIGGKREDYEPLKRLWTDLSVPGGYRFFPGHGAGHFVKMVHNGIEYGMMQAIAEGFTIMRDVDYDLDLDAVADLYDHGSVVESRLVGWLREAYALYGDGLEGISGTVAQTGEGLWTTQAAAGLGVDSPVIDDSVEFRKRSELEPSYTGQVLSALRERFGGHEAKA